MGFIRDEIAGEDLEYVLGSAHHRNYVKTYVGHAGYQALPPDLVAGEADGEDRPDEGNRFDEALRDAPPTCSDYSSFHRHPFNSVVNVSIARCVYGQL